MIHSHIAPSLAVAVLASATLGQDTAEPIEQSTTDTPPVTQPAPAPDAASEQSLLENDDPSPLTVLVAAGADFALDAGIDNGGGDVSIFRAGGGVSLRQAMSDTTTVNLGLSYVVSEYDFDNLGSLIPGAGDDPIDTLNTINITTGITRQLDDRVSLFGNVSAAADFEMGADLGESLTFGTIVGIGYQATSDLQVNIGLSARTELETDESILPVVGIRWEFAEDWLLATTGGIRRPAETSPLVGGFAAELSHRPAEELTVFLRGTFQSDTYRLADDNDIANDGLFDDQRFDLALGADYRPAPGLDIRLTAGVRLYQELDFENGAGGDIADENVDPTPFFGAILTYRF